MVLAVASLGYLTISILIALRSQEEELIHWQAGSSGARAPQIPARERGTGLDS